jgi:uncharacterized protein (TIGR02145 family)
MKTNLFLPLAAILTGCLAFTLSCSGDGGGGDGDSSDSNGAYKSSSSGGSSSSVCRILSLPSVGGNVVPCPDASTTPVNAEGIGSVACGGEIYKTVKIGGQVWMAKNLNYAVGGSKCYDDDPANCDKYGRLCDWATTMDLPSSCNSCSCGSQEQPEHRGICPEGWHIPSDMDWEALDIVTDKDVRAVDGGWINKGTDAYGFAALPGGLWNGDFSGAGNTAIWLSTSEYEAIRATNWVIFDVIADSPLFSAEKKGYLRSVRCLQDGSEPIAPPSNPNVVHGPSVDYEGETYETVVIGEQTWMARN